MQFAVGEGTAHGTANPRNVSAHLILRGGCCKHCCNWRRDGEQSQGGDLQASANLLCVHADGCSFSLSPQSWQASTGGGFNLMFTAGRQPSLSSQPVLQPRGWRLAGDPGWVGGPALGSQRPKDHARGWPQDPLLWWASLGAVWQSPALEVVTLQLSKLQLPAMSLSP